MGNFSVDEKNKCIAYKELIEELNQQIKEKENAIQNLEVEYFKKWLLNNVLKIFLYDQRLYICSYFIRLLLLIVFLNYLFYILNSLVLCFDSLD